MEVTSAPGPVIEAVRRVALGVRPVESLHYTHLGHKAGQAIEPGVSALSANTVRSINWRLPTIAEVMMQNISLHCESVRSQSIPRDSPFVPTAL